MTRASRASDEAPAFRPQDQDWVQLVLAAPEGDTHLVFRSDGTLWQGARLVRLPPLQQRLLRCFCNRAGEVIAREELIEAAWGHQEISEQSLARAIHLLRRVLADSGLGAHCISTLYGSGYILTVPVAQNAQDLVQTTAPVPEQPAVDAAVPQTATPAPTPTPTPAPTAAPNAPSPRVAAGRQRALEHRFEARCRLQRLNPAVLPAALQHLHRAEQLEPGQPATHLELCRTLFMHAIWGLRDSRDCSQAIHQLLDVETLPQGHDIAWRTMQAETLTLLDWQPRRSEVQFGALMAQPQDRGDLVAAWAHHLLATSRPMAAFQALQPHLDNHLPWGWTTAACCLWLLNDLDGAVQALQTVLVLDPDQVAARLLLALISCQRGRSSDANGLLEQAARLSRASLTTISHHPLMVTALTGQGAIDQARLMIKDGLRQPRQAWPSLWGVAAMRIGVHVEASIWFERALEKRCPLAPFLWQSPLLQAYRGHPSLRRLAAAMEVFSAPGA